MADENIKNRLELEKLIFGRKSAQRFTQDSPILPDVWIKYGQNPDDRVDLLINPYGETPPGEVFLALEERLDRFARLNVERNEFKDRNSDLGERAKLAYNKSVVVADLRFGELVSVVLPMTSWWNEYVIKKEEKLAGWWNEYELKKRRALTSEDSDVPWRFQRVSFFDDFLENSDLIIEDLKIWDDERRRNSDIRYPLEWLWMVRVMGRIALMERGEAADVLKISDQDAAHAFREFISFNKPLLTKNKPIVWGVTLNRPAATAVWRSTVAVKADSGRMLFNVSCKKLSWAIVDSGIDATHPAFRRRDAEGRLEILDRSKDWSGKTRVKATYDFTKIRRLLTEKGQISESDAQIWKELGQNVRAADMSIEQRKKTLRNALNHGFNINWEVLEQLLQVNHDSKYRAPFHEHGTHVAGILGGDWRRDENNVDEDEDLTGVCPDINLYDFRVLDNTGKGDEFSVMAALQFIRYLNSHKEYISIHGVNMSLSIYHDVVNYACGRTPVCEECDRLTQAGTVVVAAAGNQGYLKFLMADSRPAEGYRSISVTDPGNAESVITVGSTHSTHPHSYGISYFSSRGPTGDGRLKPDIVAPGEKIRSTIPGERTGPKDGTSMAAPHVSGAAAMLMARHTELTGNPERIKEILCRTATDLGRERYFQGAGMIDILRALQSV